MASADNKPWTADPTMRVYGLQVILLKRIYVLPWTQFLYAEGTSEEVRGVFSTHDVVVKGSGLDCLFADFASQQITVLKEPARSDKFAAGEGPRVMTVQVREIDGSEST